MIDAVLREETGQVASQCNGRAPKVSFLDDCELWFDITQGGVGDDGDGLTYWQEVRERAPLLPAYGTDPTEWDTDGDGMSDREHIYGANLNSDEDADNDDMSAIFEVDISETDPIITNNKYAILWNTVDAWDEIYGMKSTLETYYSYDSIRLYDGNDATSLALESAINQVASGADANDIVYIFLSSHGKDGHILCNDGTGMEHVSVELLYPTLNEWLNRITCKMLIVTIDACHSGSAIEPLRNGVCPRVIYSSCSASQQASGLQSFNTQFSLALMPTTSAYNEADDVYGDGNGYVSIYEAFLYADDHDNDYWEDKPQGEQTAQASVHTWGMSTYLGEAVNPFG